MGYGFKAGGGSNPLNFKVVGGTSEPANPKENTIWINTSTTITDWVFSSTQPTAKTGRVWINTGTSSNGEFNAFKNNTLQVYPISAKQYIGGEWVDKTAKSYQGGKWVEWVTYLYNNGDDCTSLTGGWSGAWTNANGCFHIEAKGNQTWYPEWTKTRIDLTKAKTLTIKYAITETGGALQFSMRLGLMSTEPPSIALYSAPTYVSSVVCSEAESQAVLDVSSFTGAYYVVFTNPASMNTTKTDVFEVIIE